MHSFVKYKILNSKKYSMQAALKHQQKSNAMDQLEHVWCLTSALELTSSQSLLPI